MSLGAIATRWHRALRPAESSLVLPSSELGARQRRDRLSDLEAGTLAELAFEDDECAPDKDGQTIKLTIERDSPTAPLGVELDIWARHSAAAAMCTIGGVDVSGISHGHLRVGDAICRVNGRPCCTIEDVRKAIAGCCEIEFEIFRPAVADLAVASDASLAANGRWVGVELRLSSARVLEMRPHEASLRPTTLLLRDFDAVSIDAARQLRICMACGTMWIVRLRAADLERWHTLLTQLILFRPETRCDLTGWVDHRLYFELYSNGTALVYASPHRNKVGQALWTVSLRKASVAADPLHAGEWLVTDGDRSATVWRCSDLQAIDAETPEQVLVRHSRS